MDQRPLWQHQQEDFELSKDLRAAAFYWEPRLGKSRIVIETARYLKEQDLIDAVIIIAPNGVHLNWTREELPKYWPTEDLRTFEWDANKAANKSFKIKQEQFLKTTKFIWLAVNVEGVWAKRLSAYLDRFIKKKRCLLVVDESHTIKNPRAKRTRKIMKVSEADGCYFVRILSGTPSPQGPFDLFSQFYVLDPKIFGNRYVPFKNRYGIFRRVQYGHNAKAFDELVKYRNLGKLQKLIAPITFVRKKADCLDLPPRIFTKQHFILPPEHRRAFDTLQRDLVVKIQEGVEISAPEALSQLLRLQQISRGHVKLESGEIHRLGGPYPSVEATLDLVEGNIGKTIIWCRFIGDINSVTEELVNKEIQFVRCDGSVPAKERPDLRVQFREDPETIVWIGTAETGGVGVDLASASLMIFYSYSFNLVHREQALERNYGSEQKADQVDVIDLIGADTKDQYTLDNLERKVELTNRITGREILKQALMDGE